MTVNVPLEITARTLKLEIPDIALRERCTSVPGDSEKENPMPTAESTEIDFKEALYELVSRIAGKVASAVVPSVVGPKILVWHGEENQRRNLHKKSILAIRNVHDALYKFSEEERKAIVDSVLASF